MQTARSWVAMLDHLASFIIRIIINYDQFVSYSTGFLAKNTFDRRRQHRRSIVGGYDDGNVRRLIHKRLLDV
jgi:hypothetical protein